MTGGNWSLVNLKGKWVEGGYLGRDLVLEQGKKTYWD